MEYWLRLVIARRPAAFDQRVADTTAIQVDSRWKCGPSSRELRKACDDWRLIVQCPAQLVSDTLVTRAARAPRQCGIHRHDSRTLVDSTGAVRACTTRHRVYFTMEPRLATWLRRAPGARPVLAAL